MHPKSNITKKIPIILLILVNGKLISDFQEKATLFNNHFTSQCNHVEKANKLPNFKYKTDKRLTAPEIHENDILLTKKI